MTLRTVTPSVKRWTLSCSRAVCSIASFEASAATEIWLAPSIHLNDNVDFVVGERAFVELRPWSLKDVATCKLVEQRFADVRHDGVQ